MDKIRIMVADDFDLLREDLEETISKQDDMCVVGSAATGQEIVKKAIEGRPDIILMDIEMESMNAGIKAAEEIINRIPEMKIIFLTAHETEQMVLTSMGVGAVDYIVKGCDDDKILFHIRQAYNGNPVLDGDIQHTVLREYSRLRHSEDSLLFFIHNVSQLTSAERELIKYLLQNKKIREIAEIRCVEIVTVKTQIKGLLRKFGCSRTKEVVDLINELNIAHLF